MSLRPKIVLLICSVVVLYTAFDHGIQRTVISESFEDLEREEAKRDMNRVLQAIGREIEVLDERCEGLAAWDDTYRFVHEPYDEYVQSNLGSSTFDHEGITLLYICDESGRVVWGRIQDPETGERTSMRWFPGESLAAQHPLMLHQGPTDALKGLFTTEKGPLLVSSRRILTSARQGPERGVVIVGRLLGAELVGRLSEQTAVEFGLWPLEEADAVVSDRELLDEATSTGLPVVDDGAAEDLAVYATFPDIQAAPALLVRALVDREISLRGARASRYALISTLASGLLILLVFLKLLQRTVLDPIAKLTGHAVEIGRTEDFSTPLGLERDDEIGILSREFDSMMEKLMQSRAAFVKAARLAGMSEIATGVLHNVGNVLNSVNVSATLVANRLRNSDVRDLGRMAEVLEAHKDDLGSFVAQDPRGQHLQPFLTDLSRQLVTENGELVREVGALTEGIEHIKKLINSQQTHAGRSEVLEPTAVVEQLEGALDITRQSVSYDSDPVHVVRELEDVPRVLVDKHKLMEILVNLIRNARQAMEEARVPDPRIELRLRRPQPEILRVEVIDNGPGITAENLARIFNHGFTTKPNGHGFGLHSSANSATEMGGRLWAESDGPGTGATFVLEIPVKLARLAA